MFHKAVATQIKLLLRQKEAAITFYILLILCLINYIDNVVEFQGYDVVEMFHPMKLLLLSYNRTYYNADMTLFFIQLYPMLVVCPAGLALVKEQHSKQEMLIVSRMSRGRYYCTKLLAVFVVTTLVFTVPFYIEMLLNCVAFPLGATGDLSYRGFYDEVYMEGVRNYFMSALYVKTSYVYTFICILFFGIISGILGVFVVAFSIVVQIKYKILLFLPVYLLLNATLYIGNIITREQTNWFSYILIFNDEAKNYAFFGIILLLCIAFIIISLVRGSKKELL